MMRIKKYELKKILCSPIFIALTIIFLLYNTLLIFQKKHQCDEVNALSDIVCSSGYKIDDSMMSDFKKYYQDTLSSTNSYLEHKGFKTYDTMGEFIDKNDVYVGKYSKFSKEDVKKLQRTAAIELYYNLTKSYNGSYDYDLNSMIKHLMSLKYNDKVKAFMKKNYEEAAVRVNEIKNKGEQKNLFFYGKQYRMHSFLFKDILTAIIYEIMIIVVLATSYVLNYEFENKTASVIYTCRRGRKILRDKISVSLLYTLFISTVIITITFFVYFLVFNYSGVIHSTVNSFLSQESMTPYKTWWSMSYMKQIVLAVAVIYILEIIFCILSFIIQSFVKNTYLDFMIFAVIGGFLMIMPSLIAERFSAVLYSAYTPFTMIINPSWWFMIKDKLLSSKYYEIVTLSIWIIMMIILFIVMLQKFKREDIKQG